jgi:Ig-like domain from next to BRCA1 gene
MMNLLAKARSSSRITLVDTCYNFDEMMKKPYSRIVIWSISILIILGCAIPSLAVPTPVPLPASQSFDVLGTSVVETAAVAQAKTASALPSATLTPTITFTPTITHTPTPTYVFPFLFTSTTIASLTAIVPVSVGGSGSAAPPEDASKFKTPQPWSCVVISKQPPKGAVIEKESQFYAFWRIRNTGTKTWTRTTIDLVYRGGYRHENTKIQDTTETVAPGDTLTVSAFFIAPKKAGDYNSYFALKVGRDEFCGMSISFTVKKDR